MNLEINFIDRGYFFVDEVALSPAKRETTIENFEKKSDSFICTILGATLMGRLTLSEEFKEIVNLLRDPDTKKTMAKKANVEITESRSISVNNTTPVPIDDAPPEVVDTLSALLQGSIKKVVENLGNVKLAKEEIEKLINLERDGKNRSAIKAVLISAIG
jgi:hypothetical protein